MPYNLTLTNGSALVTVADNTYDYTTTSLNIIGANYPGYGLPLNENFIKLLESFSSSNAPSNPLQGQLWWDSTNKHLSVYQGVNWKVISSSQTGSTAPVNPVTGDFWWNTNLGQFSVYSGSAWIPIGPAQLPGQSVTAISANTVIDTGTTPHVVGNVLVNNKLAGIFSSDSLAFTPQTPISGYSVINPGLNISTSLTVMGNATVSNLTVSGYVTGNIAPSANLTYNLGSPTAWWNNIYGTAVHAQYADLAERFEADDEYSPGTVVELGGSAEITASANDLSEDVFGVISTRAAYLMNSEAGSDITHPPIAVQGRVPVRVTGVIKKGDRLVSAGNGIARAGSKTEINTWNVLGRALENKTTLGEGVIEAVVKLNS